MYIASDKNQLTIEDFFMPFGSKLLKSNLWVKLAERMPWEHIEAALILAAMNAAYRLLRWLLRFFQIVLFEGDFSFDYA